ncbi:hypothetical protein [Neobacillus jeddahensis]|uniref:hypothetical protein n=1 Tax=Neobacillus jeddahensis TaxID=1461580 RepID=UPI00058F87CC|nr:hypothetical protein [Neobacillus jeddahensis]
MEQNPKEERRRIFRQVLFTLREEGYLSPAIVEMVAKAHHQYYLDLLELSPLPAKEKETVPMAVPLRPAKVKKTRTLDEIRERNITWLLNIGVIFLLIGGLFVATSNWESMTSLMKSGSIAIVSILFYGIAFVTKKGLHIDKTAFAFTVLGSLFLPIFILSLGWFELLGPYLSVNGEGRYLLGMLGSLVPITIYIFLAKKLNSRLFVWFTYVSLSIGLSFLLAALNLRTDFYYLGIVIINTIFIIAYQRLKDRVALKLFTQEMVPYIQIHLIISTLTMLFIYDNEVIHGFNLLLTGIIYLSMIYVSGRKEYHFIFTIMLVYGAYQVIEHSALDQIGAIFYASLAFGLVFIPKVLDNKFSLEKVFQYTSGVLSGFAFIYISVEAFLIRTGTPSIVLLFAYLIMATNFLYLAFNRKERIFPYLSSLFFASTSLEAVDLLNHPFGFFPFPLLVFIAGFLLFCVFGFRRMKWVMILQTASKDVGIGIMVLAVLISFTFLMWWELGIMLILLSISAYLLHKFDERVQYKQVAIWVIPIAWGLSIMAFGEEMIGYSGVYAVNYGYPVNLACGALFVLCSSLLWNKIGEIEIGKLSLYTAQILYTLAIFCVLVDPLNQPWVQPAILTIGIGMYTYLYKLTGIKWIPFFISIEVLFSYFSIIHAVSLLITFSRSVDSLIASTGAVILLLTAFIWRKWDHVLSSAFAWVGHIVYPFTLVYTLFVFHDFALYSFILAIFVYALSSRYAVREWQIKVYLYGCFTSLFFIVTTAINMVFADYLGQYNFLITSGLILLFSLVVKGEYARRTTYYLVSFSMLGIGFSLLIYPYNGLQYLVTLSYVVGLLVYLHKVKWDIFGLVPLIFAFFATVEFSYSSEIMGLENMLLFGGLGILMIFIGQSIYKKVVSNGKMLLDTKIDGYTMVSFLYFVFMYFIDTENLWTHALPGCLIAIAIWLQAKRVPVGASVFMSILGGTYLLQPYYSVIYRLNIADLWKREVLVLPFILLVIFIQKNLKGRYAESIKAIQWGVLISVSLLLIQDGLASNTVYDAIILGTLSLVSMLTGMFLRIKSYFFVGAGVLLLNVFLQTRPYWGNMPWWVYLLIAGMVLITVASFNEWHKQKVQKGESTFFTLIKNKIIEKIKNWD